MRFRKNEYSAFDAAIEAAQRFWAEIFCNTRVNYSGSTTKGDTPAAAVARYQQHFYAASQDSDYYQQGSVKRINPCLTLTLEINQQRQDNKP